MNHISTNALSFSDDMAATRCKFLSEFQSCTCTYTPCSTGDQGLVRHTNSVSYLLKPIFHQRLQVHAIEEQQQGCGLATDKGGRDTRNFAMLTR